MNAFDNHYKRKVFTVKVFLFTLTLEGAIVVYEFLRMPLSMPKRAFFFGFSLLRILILIGVVGITALIGLTFDLCLS